jgi:hypothetical protein
MVKARAITRLQNELGSDGDRGVKGEGARAHEYIRVLRMAVSFGTKTILTTAPRAGTRIVANIMATAIVMEQLQ